METPTCAYCKKKWSYKTTLKNLFKLEMTCPHCDAENFVQDSKRSIMPMFFIAPPLIVLVLYFDLTIPQLLLIAVPFLIIHFLLMPLRTRLQKVHR